ncbi:putative pstC1 gene product [Megalodesulfovibrio gigas DSM 1382 = ATCC 19364]|uniref:Phosphate transport system permease protein n=1 Tax=Megalodesulfovibrio gigas (strain ATCC 19364 / DSM 1382 / NCIMB 9332 / VKM B-1759) TaxID=1121448 RepID=T2GBV8_MEGG1|nr:putative pstC1 gene product [Megalodesulfovibrio gigas DSM 1382 = ATCC 19364]
MSAVAYMLGRNRAFAVAGGPAGLRHLHSRPGYYGALTALWCFGPAIIVFALWQASEGGVITGLVVSHLPPEVQALPPDRLGLVVNDVKNLVGGNILSGDPSPELRKAADEFIRLRVYSRVLLLGVCAMLAAGGLLLSRKGITPQLRARNKVERLVKWLLIACSMLAIFTTVGIILSVLFEAIRFFKIIPVQDFLFGLEWSPQMAIREDQVGGSGAFGAVPVFVGTALISIIAMVVAVPIGLMAAIYMSEYASRKFRATAKPLMEILAGIPTVVYGFFAALTVAPIVRDWGSAVGLSVSSESGLVAGLVMGIMIIPFVSSLSDDVINAVPQSLRDGALALGSTSSETVRKVVLPAALPGIVGSVLLAMSRAIGETMIVVMAAGLSANLTLNPFETVTTVTVQIVTLLIGDQEFDSPKTLAAFALGLVLFLVTLCLNIFALHVVRKYREQYE